MIHYDLRCGAGHEFDSWFRDSAAFERQRQAGLVECPACGSAAVEKRLMAPAIPKKGRVRTPEPPPGRQPEAGGPEAGSPEAGGAEAKPEPTTAAGPLPAQVLAQLQRLRREVERNCDYVGKDFVAEARKIHQGESDRRGIYGEASDAEAETLKDEGIDIARLPWVPRADG